MTTPETRGSSQPWAFIRPVQGPWLPAMHDAVRDIAGEAYTFELARVPGVSYADRNELARIPLFEGIDDFETAQAVAQETLDRVVSEEQVGLASIAQAVSWEGLHYSSSVSSREYGFLRVRFNLQDNGRVLGRQKHMFKRALGIPVPEDEEPSRQLLVTAGYLQRAKGRSTSKRPRQITELLNERRRTLPPIILGPVTFVEKN